MIDLAVADDFAAAGVAVTVGCVAAAVAVAARDAALARALAEVAARRADELAGRSLAEVPEIAAARRAYRALGKDPTRHRVSSEALMRRLVKGKGLAPINTLVDTNNLVSLETGLSCGTFRAEAIEPPVVFRKGRAGERYDAIGRGPMNLENLPVFADGAGPFGCTTSDSERTMITPDTRHALMVLIAFEEAPEMERHVGVAARALETYCAGRGIETAVVGNAAG